LCEAGARGGAAAGGGNRQGGGDLNGGHRNEDGTAAGVPEAPAGVPSQRGRILRSPGAVDAELAVRSLRGTPRPKEREGPAGQPGGGEMGPQAQATRKADPRLAACRGAHRAGRADADSGTRRPRRAPWAVHGKGVIAVLASRGAAGATRSPPTQEDHAQGTLKKKRNALFRELE